MNGQNKITKVGLFGCGKWGSKIAKKLIDHPEYELSFISTWSGNVPEEFKDIPKFNGWGTPRTDDVDLIYIATPADKHYAIIREAILANKAIICEKPALMSFDRFKAVDAMIYFSGYNKLFLTNFTHTFNNGFLNFVEQLKASNEPGTLYFNVCGPIIRKETSVKLDYGAHVLSMIIHAVNSLGYKTSEISWEIGEDGGTFNIDKYTGIFNWKTQSERLVSMGFVSDRGERAAWIDDRKEDSVGNMLNLVSQSLNSGEAPKSSNFQLMAETVFALDETIDD